LNNDIYDGIDFVYLDIGLENLEGEIHIYVRGEYDKI